MELREHAGASWLLFQGGDASRGRLYKIVASQMKSRWTWRLEPHALHWPRSHFQVFCTKIEGVGFAPCPEDDDAKRHMEVQRSAACQLACLSSEACQDSARRGFGLHLSLMRIGTMHM